MKLLTTILLLLLSCTHIAYSQLYTLRNFGHKDGLNMSNISSLFQCNNGLIWIGTDGAELITFDGTNFEEIQFRNEFQDHHYTSITHAHDTILFSSQYKGFFFYIKKLDTIGRLYKPKSNLGQSLGIFRESNLTYFITEKEISVSKNKQRTVIKQFSDEEDYLKLYDIIALNKGHLLLSNKGPLFILKGKVSSLSEWAKTKIHHPKEFTNGYFKNGQITLLNKKADRWLTILLPKNNNTPSSIREYNETDILEEGETIISTSHNKVSKVTGALSDKGNIYLIEERKLKKVQQNDPDHIKFGHKIITDLNGDFWIASKRQGLYKVSKEPFTQLRTNPIFKSKDILQIHRTFDQRTIISTINNKTYILSDDSETPLKTYNFKTLSIHSQNDSIYYLGTTKGVKTYAPGNPIELNPFLYQNESILFIYEHEGNLWIGILDKGIAKYNLKTKKLTEYSNLSLPHFFYTAQHIGDKIYFGTNRGIIKYDPNSDQFTRIRGNKYSGTYVGNSCKDRYGNIWFTREKGLQGILRNGKIKFISSNYFPSNLLYTLQADNYGNLYIGSNKGITKIEISKNGNVLSKETYSGDRGFEGYETHMRAQFKEGDQLYVGTIEGLFLINTKQLHESKPPYPPVIYSLLTDEEMNKTGEYKFGLKVNNPKDNHVRYKYRIKGIVNEWTAYNNEDLISLRGIANGTYIIEAVASYDDTFYSEPTTFVFNVKKPFWESKWFTIFIVTIIVFINLIILFRSKRFSTTKLLNSKETELEIQNTPEIILFGIIFHGGSILLGSQYFGGIDINLGIFLFISFILICLYFLSLNARQNNATHLYKYYLLIGLSIVSLHFIIELYLSELHPFHILGIVLTGSITPFVLNKFKHSIIYSLIVFFLSLSVSIFVHQPVYPKIFFLISLFSSFSLIIFNSYLRNSSIEKLLFVSSLVNNGNMPVIAFTDTGKITFVSDNINQFININASSLIDKNISILNHHVTYDDEYKDVDVTNFSNDDIYLVPMSTSNDEVIWIEWRFKKYDDDFNVIIGQDVSEKVEVQNTHELLVQNVEDLIFTTDSKGYFTFLNESFISKLGYRREEIVGTNFTNYVAQEYREKTKAFYFEHFKEKKKSSYLELPIYKKNKEIIWIGQYVNTVFSPGSRKYITGFISLARDITEDRRKQQIIKEQRDDIRSSINYAKRIQMNLLPKEATFKEIFNDFFILYKPKDIVSGDFYWTSKVHHMQIVALGDCTGHGVPGAFMTLLGINLLNSIINDAKQTEPSVILNEMDRRLYNYLNNNKGERVNDGMEITILVFDKISNQVAYACAGSRFLVKSAEEFTMHKGNNEHIGGPKPDSFKGYITQYTSLDKNDIVYLFTDGYQDQFGGIKNKKYSFRRLLELFETNANLPLDVQKLIFEKEFETWKGEQVQTDDVTIFAFQCKHPKK